MNYSPAVPEVLDLVEIRGEGPDGRNRQSIDVSMQRTEICREQQYEEEIVGTHANGHELTRTE